MVWIYGIIDFRGRFVDEFPQASRCLRCSLCFSGVSLNSFPLLRKWSAVKNFLAESQKVSEAEGGRLLDVEIYVPCGASFETSLHDLSITLQAIPFYRRFKFQTFFFENMFGKK